MSKQIKIGYHDSTFTVISVKNTTEHLPGEVIPKRDVDELCQSRTWDVTLVPLNNVKEKAS